MFNSCISVFTHGMFICRNGSIFLTLRRYYAPCAPRINIRCDKTRCACLCLCAARTTLGIVAGDKTGNPTGNSTFRIPRFPARGTLTFKLSVHEFSELPAPLRFETSNLVKMQLCNLRDRKIQFDTTRLCIYFDLPLSLSRSLIVSLLLITCAH